VAEMKMMVEWMRYPVLLLALLPVLCLCVLVDFLYNLLHSTCQEIWSEHRARRPFSASAVEPFAFIWDFGIAYQHFATKGNVEEFCAKTLEPTTFI